MKFFRTYLLPGFVFQSLTIGGGYGTGREIVQFFLTQGPADGLLAMLVATLIWSLVLAISFELARMTQKLDYRTFLGQILGKGWIAYEVVYLIGMVLVISVMGSAAGELVDQIFGIPSLVGIMVMIIVVGILAFFGTSLIEKVLSAWSLALYAVYIALVIMFFREFSTEISDGLQMAGGEGQWFRKGMEYAAYNVGIVPAILFVVHHLNTRREALISGGLAGLIAMIPALFVYLAMLSQYPEILPESVPANFLLDQLGIGWFQVIFQIVLFGTLIETGVGLIHGFNERIATVYKEGGKQMPHTLRAAIAVVVLVIAIFLADSIGLIDLIAKGYTALTWGYWLVFVFPVLGYGIWKIGFGR